MSPPLYRSLDVAFGRFLLASYVLDEVAKAAGGPKATSLQHRQFLFVAVGRIFVGLARGMGTSVVGKMAVQRQVVQTAVAEAR